MAKMPKPAELRQWNDHELDVEVQKIERELFDLRSQATTERIQAPSEIWLRKKQVARIRTILNERAGGRK
jgi:large subunit ribosomal protein L29